MVGRQFEIALAALAVAGMAILGAAQADAAPSRHQAAAHHHAHRARPATQQLVSDGPGTSFGFHRDPAPFRVGAWRQRYRQANATHQAVMDDALTTGGYYGFPGDSVYGEGNEAAYGVFDGADGYGSPFFAGFYGPADGPSYGPFGNAYND